MFTLKQYVLGTLIVVPFTLAFAAVTAYAIKLMLQAVMG